jgi:hypothetical protein
VTWAQIRALETYSAPILLDKEHSLTKVRDTIRNWPDNFKKTHPSMVEILKGRGTGTLGWCQTRPSSSSEKQLHI